MQKGIKNELDFAEMIDKKLVKELNCEIQKMILNLFDEIDMNTRVICWQSKYNEKADIKIKINNEIKGVSIKSGKYSSMHQENKNSFYQYLTKIGISDTVISKFDNYMLGYIFEKRVNAQEYIKYKSEEIKKIIKDFNKYYHKVNLIMRFLFQGTDKNKYGCDAIILGTPNNFIWATKDEILKYLSEYYETKSNYINISRLNIKCYDRNLRNNKYREKKQNDIQVKWFTIYDDIKAISNNRDISINKK